MLLSAALRLLGACGADASSIESRTRRLPAESIIVTQYRGRPDTAVTNPDLGATFDDSNADEFLVDISAGEVLATIRWQGNGSAKLEYVIRGPWEFDFLKAAGIDGLESPGVDAREMLLPASSDSWVMQGGRSPKTTEWRLSQPLLFAILGDHSSVSELIDEDAGLQQMTDVVRATYCRARSIAPALIVDSRSTGFVSVWAWANPSRFSYDWPTQRPLLRYCVSKRTPFEDVAHMLLSFDRSVYQAEIIQAEMTDQLHKDRLYFH